MVPLVRKMLVAEKAKLWITVSAVAITVMLMLFLSGIYEGVKLGAIGYVKHSPADIWICQNNSRNLLRSSSFLQKSAMDDIAAIDAVASAEGILRIIATARIGTGEETMFIFGIPEGALLSRPKMAGGEGVPGKREIIIDRSFALKHSLVIGDSMTIQERDFRITGICTETNATVAQYSFVSLDDAQDLLGFRDIVSFILVRTSAGTDVDTAMGNIRHQYPNLSVFDRDTFIANNLREMQTGVLPILGTILILGIFSGVLVITLMFYQSVLDMRDDYALMKAIGARSGFLSSLVLRQTLLVTSLGFLVGMSLTLLTAPLLEQIVPALNVVTLWRNVGFVLIVSLVVGSVGSALPLKKLQEIYPAEVFRV